MRDNQPKRVQRIIYILMPLTLLIVCLVGINLVTWWNSRPGELATAVSPTPINVTEIEQTAVSPTPPPATATVTPQPTPTIRPTLPPNAQISLQGPPVDSILFVNQTITFYWQWPVELAEGDQLTLFLLTSNGEFIAGAQTEPNLGKQYQLQLTPNQLAIEPQTAQWQVRLSDHLGEVLLESDKRPLTLIPAP